jgi:hypothetical protein
MSKETYLQRKELVSYIKRAHQHQHRLPQVKRQNADKARLAVLAAAFLPLTGEQVATLLAFVAIATGERVVRRATAD